jgi:hypothetical protein
LGRPIQGEFPEGAYEAWHENALVIWMNLLPGFAIMPFDSKKWIHRDDLKQDTALQKDEYVRQLLRRQIPKGKFPPTGGVATLFQQDIDQWITVIGWREADCIIPDTHIQRFEHGWIIGPVLLDPKRSDSRYLVLLDNDERYPEYANASPACQTVKHG